MALRKKEAYLQLVQDSNSSEDQLGIYHNVMQEIHQHKVRKK